LTLLNDHLLSKCCLTRAQQCTLMSEGYAQTCKSWEDKMNIAEFKASITEKAPPANLPVPLAALWWDAKGDWAEAHAQVDELETVDGMAVHAYLHRKEGSASNADYWYQRAGRIFQRPTFDAEWTALVESLLAQTANG
jgi:hypothetical protein